MVSYRLTIYPSVIDFTVSAEDFSFPCIKRTSRLMLATICCSPVANNSDGGMTASLRPAVQDTSVTSSFLV
jgi:hypothetical protein